MQDHFRTTGHSLGMLHKLAEDTTTLNMGIHPFHVAVDGATGIVYCHACQDWVYALAFEGALGRLRRLQEERLDISVGEQPDLRINSRVVSTQARLST